MDLLSFILIVFFLCVLIFLVYYFIRGAKGDISLARPVESRVDEYLDRRFQHMVEEWQLVSHPKLQQFKEQHYKEIENNEVRLAELKKYESGMQTTLTNLEARLDTVEKELTGKEQPKSKDSPDLIAGLKKEITVIRKQGEPPLKDPHTFARYMCDLCSTPHTVSELRQCVLCGRWACDACWKDELYTCKSCAGMIKIHQMKG